MEGLKVKEDREKLESKLTALEIRRRMARDYCFIDSDVAVVQLDYIRDIVDEIRAILDLDNKD